MRKRIGLTLGVGIVIILLYLLFWPVPIKPAAWTPPDLPPLTGVYQENNCLAAIERLAQGVGIGPEDIAFDSQGFLYTGLEDGRILRVSLDGNNTELFANTGGRPLGLAFDAQESLIVADAFKGLLAIAPDGDIRVLTDTVDGRRINFADGLDIASDGTIFFSEASNKFAQNEFMLDLYEHQPNGCLLSYHPSTHTTQIVLDHLYFTNGVAVSPDQSFVLVAEMGMYRVQRYWLTGPRRGEADVFIENLPGFPDNIRSNGKESFWLALSKGPEAREMLDTFLPHPFVRKIFLRVPEAWLQSPPSSSYVLKLDKSANILLTLQDPKGQFYADLTTVREYSGMLYLGSSTEDAIARISLP